MSSLRLVALFFCAAACGEVKKLPDGGGGNGDGNIGGPCTANTVTCANNVVTVCNASGMVESESMCGPLGCASTGDRCNLFQPSNGVATELDDAANGPSITLNDVTPDTVINSDTGDVTHNGAPLTIPSVLKTQTGAPSLRVFKVKDLTIQNNVVITGSNAIAFVASGKIEVAAFIDLGAKWKAPAAGAFQSGTCNGVDGTTVGLPSSGPRSPGTGGGGLGLNGAKGGNGVSSYGTAFGTNGGIPAGTVDLQPLRGGCRGGNIASSDAYFANEGGAGGGAIQLTSSTQIVIAATGIINVGGGGGDFGKSGTGGGSGGGILLEAPDIVVDGTIAANGGGGSCLNEDGENGQYAYRLGSLAALGGGRDGGCTTTDGAGGIGGTKDNSPGIGQNGTGCTTGGAYCSGGGGGGAVGRIRVNSATGSFTKGSASLVSPIASEATLVVR